MRAQSGAHVKLRARKVWGLEINLSTPDEVIYSSLQKDYSYLNKFVLLDENCKIYKEVQNQEHRFLYSSKDDLLKSFKVELHSSFRFLLYLK